MPTVVDENTIRRRGGDRVRCRHNIWRGAIQER
jgi:hypothetical protein